MKSVETILQQSPVLDEEKHKPLIRELDGFAAQAGVHRHMIHTPLAELATQAEVDWVQSVPSLRRNGYYGRIYVGKQFDPPVEIRMMAMAAACVRNFVDARVIPIHQLVGVVKQGQPTSTVLLVPNFCVDPDGGGYMPAWVKGLILDLLYQRLTEQKLTVLGVADKATLDQGFGQPFADLIHHNYDTLTS